MTRRPTPPPARRPAGAPSTPSPPPAPTAPAGRGRAPAEVVLPETPLVRGGPPPAPARPDRAGHPPAGPGAPSRGGRTRRGSSASAAPRPRRRRPRARWVVVGVAALLLVAGAGAALLATPLTALRRVEVVGAVHTPPAQVLAATDGQLGRPLLRVDSRGVARAVGALPWVRGVALERRWPHVLLVRVSEARAVAALPTGEAGAGPYDLVDDRGTTIARADAVPEGVPVVSVARGAGAGAVRAASRVADALPESLRAQVTSITATSDQDVRLTLAGGGTVRWGSAQRSALKARVLTELRATGARDYDVSAPDAPATS